MAWILPGNEVIIFIARLGPPLKGRDSGALPFRDDLFRGFSDEPRSLQGDIVKHGRQHAALRPEALGGVALRVDRAHLGLS